MKIHISRNGQSYGPYTNDEFLNHVKTGHIGPMDLAWHEGIIEWKPLNTFQGFENIFANSPLAPNEPQPSYHHVALWKFTIFSLCSLGLYDLYWFYKNWEAIRKRDNSSIYPFWRTVFSLFWCYPLAKDVAGKKGANPAIPVLVAISYVALTVTYKLPDPYWIPCVFSFVPLLLIVRQIDQINRGLGIRANYYARFKIRHFFGCFVGALFLAFAITASFNLIPSSQVVSGERLLKRHLSFLNEARIVNDAESVLYFYSTGLFSVEDEGNLITNRRVISYERDPESGELLVYDAAYKNIADIEVTYSESFLDDTLIRIETTDEYEFHLVVSAEEKGDKRFVNKLMDLWKQHRAKD